MHAAAAAIMETSGMVMIIARDTLGAETLHNELSFFLRNDERPILHLPDWETLIYDSFSPHQDIVSERLRVLASLPGLERGILIASAPALLQRLPPRRYVAERSLELLQRLKDRFRQRPQDEPARVAQACALPSSGPPDSRRSTSVTSLPRSL